MVDAEPKGIGGWLILPIIGFIFNVVWLGYSTVLMLQTIQFPWSLISFANLIFMGAYIVTLVFIFEKSRFAPHIAVYTMLAVFIFYGYYAMATFDVGPAANALFSLTVWGTYFARSKRVHNTFVE